MSKKKRRRHKPTARAKRMEQFAADILAATISGLIVLAVQKLLNWYRPGVRRPKPPHPKYKRNPLKCQ